MENKEFIKDVRLSAIQIGAGILTAVAGMTMLFFGTWHASRTMACKVISDEMCPQCGKN